MNLTHRKATIHDLRTIINLLHEDELGKTREYEQLGENINQYYIDSFDMIDRDPNQYLMVVEKENIIIGTCHLTLIPSLTFKGALRMQVEAVRIDSKYHGHKIGKWMINEALLYAKSCGASIIQLTTNKVRKRAIKFYESLGFEASHEGMKLYI